MSRKWYENVTSINITWGRPANVLQPRVAARAAASLPVPKEGAKPGRGFNTFTSEARGDALAESPMTSLAGDGQEVKYSVRSITSMSELNEALEVGAEASFSGFGVSASAKAEWGRNRKVNSYSVYLLIKVKVTNTTRTLKNFVLRPEAVRILGAGKDLRPFFNKYGDAFIESLHTGGEFIALYEFHTTSSEEKENLSAQLKVGGAMGSGSAEFKSKMDSIQTNTESDLTVYINGGRGKLPAPAPDKLIEAALAFPEAVDPVNGAPVCFGITVKDYQVADGFPGDIQLPFNRSHNTYRALASLRDRLSLVAADLDYVARNPRQFASVIARPTGSSIEAIDGKILELARLVAEDPTTTVNIPSDITPQIQAWETVRPPLSGIEYGPVFGVVQGTPFDDAVDKEVRVSRSLRSIAVRAGAVLDGIQFSYKRAGAPDYSPGHHGGEGGRADGFVLGDGEYLKGIVGTWGQTPKPSYGTFISTIQWITNKRKSRVYGIQQATVTQFRYEAPEGWMIFAFCGRDGKIRDKEINGIHALGPVIAKIGA